MKSPRFSKNKRGATTIMLFIATLFPSFGNAQELSNPFQTFKEKKVFIYGVDNRRTHIKSHSTLIYGLYLGIGFGGKLRFKAGISGTPFEKGKFTDDQGKIKKNRLVFINLGEEFDFLIINRFRMTTYFQAGLGYNYFRVLDASKIEIQRGRNLIIPLESGLQANYDLLPWLRAKVGGGWRFVLPDYSYDLSGYYIKIGFSIDRKKLCEVYRNKRNKKTTNR